MKQIILLALLLVFPAMAALPGNYLDLSAQQKMEAQWAEVSSTEYDEIPGFVGLSCTQLMGAASILPGRLAPTFVDPNSPIPRGHGGDELPENRSKVIHALGITAKATYRSNGDHPFSGLLAEDGAPLMIRVSQAAPTIGSFGLVPGLSIKFYVDGKNMSRNLVVMNRLDPQITSNNPFRNDFSHFVPFSWNPLIWAGEFRFALTQRNPRILTAKHLARIHVNGSVPGQTHEPHQLIFRPNDNLRYPRWLPESYLTAYSRLKSGYVLYHVFHRDSQGDEMAIGQIETASLFIASEYADKTMFFPHFREL